MMESHGITINRNNPDPEDFYMNRLINQIYKHISQSNKKNFEIKKSKEKSRKKKAKKQNKRTRKQNKRTKEQVCKIIIKLCV